jgi:hypothetical protein
VTRFRRALAGAAIIACVAAALAGLMPSALAKRSHAPTVVSASCHGHNFRPGHMVLACGDAGLYVEQLDWKHWGRQEANGIGVGVGKTCDPYCAAGGTESASMEIRLDKPRQCAADGRVHFTRVHYRWTYGSPIAHTPDAGTIPFPCGIV